MGTIQITPQRNMTLLDVQVSFNNRSERMRTPQNASEHAKNVIEYLRPPPTFHKHDSAPEFSTKYLRMSESASEPFGNLSETLRTHEDVYDQLRIHQNVEKHLKTFPSHLKQYRIDDMPQNFL